MKSKLVLVFVLACGGSSTPAPETPKPHEETAAEKKERAWNELYAQEPKVPYETAGSKSFHASRECGQGPYRIDGKMLGTQFGEEIRVVACSAHDITGHSRITLDGRSEEPQKFGWSNGGNDRCRASATELARAGDAGASTQGATSAPAKTGTAKSTGVTVEPEKLEDSDVVIAEGDDCPKGTHAIHVFGEAFSTNVGSFARAGAPFRVEIWSDEPNDLKDVTFVLRQRRVGAAMTAEKWSALQKDRDAWFARLRAFEKANDDMFVHEDAGAAPAPPPAARAETQPPKPSVHAAWVPGYYHHDGASWLWIAGFWRVPDEDVKQELATVAPTAPPPVRYESQARTRVVASHDLVWTEGHWQWDGARWVWVEGAWRLPPEQGVIWQAPAWRPRGATFVFVPGGWARRR